MIEMDNGPFAMLVAITVAYVAPFLYSFVIDKKKDK